MSLPLENGLGLENFAIVLLGSLKVGGIFSLKVGGWF